LSKVDDKKSQLGIEALFLKAFPKDLAEQLIAIFSRLDVMNSENIRNDFLKMDLEIKDAISKYIASKGPELLFHWLQNYSEVTFKRYMEVTKEEKISQYFEKLKDRENAGLMFMIFLLNWENSQRIFEKPFLEMLGLEDDNLFKLLRAIKDMASSFQKGTFENSASIAVQNTFFALEVLYKAMLKSLYLLCSPDELSPKITLGPLVDWFLKTGKQYEPYGRLFYFLDDRIVTIRNALGHFGWRLDVVKNKIIFQDHDRPPLSMSIEELSLLLSKVFNWMADFTIVHDLLKTAFYDKGIHLVATAGCGEPYVHYDPG